MEVIRYKAIGIQTVAVPKDDGSYEFVKQEILCSVERPYSKQNEELAKAEAYEGKYTIIDDGKSEDSQSDAERITELEEALDMLLSGVTE